MDRRHFCLAGAASVVCLGADHGLPAAERPPGPAIALDQVLFDSRHPGSRAFGTAAARAGWGAVAFPGDVTAMWRQILLPLWAAGGGAIAGMTTAAGLFCLEELAKGHWMRVVLRLEHRHPLPGMLVHRVTAAEPMLGRACAALSCAPDWPARSFDLLRDCVRSKNQPRISRVVSGTDPGGYSVTGSELVSWIIAT
jgi:DNA-binding transcriptional LysR family regulator